MSALIKGLENRVQELETAATNARESAQKAVQKAEAAERDLIHYRGVLSAELKREGKSVTLPAPNAHFMLATEKSDTAKLNKTDLALEIVKVSPDGVSIDDLDNGLKARGLKLSRNYVFNIASRLKSQDKIEKRGGKFYAK